MNSKKNEAKFSKYNFLDGVSMQENLFESAIGPSINNLQKVILEIESEIEETIKTLNPEQLFDDEGYRSLEFLTYTNLHNKQGWQNEQLLALNEMRVIYLYKNIEIFIKSLIKTFDESANTRSFFEWKKIIEFFKQKEIIISKVKCYQDVDDLRNLNNNLKHSDTVDDEIKRIPEFKNLEYFDSISLDAFLTRVNENIKIFQISLIVEVRGKIVNG